MVELSPRLIHFVTRHSFIHSIRTLARKRGGSGYDAPLGAYLSPRYDP